MHLTRPKSSKGRSRPTISHNPHMDTFQNQPVTPKPPAMQHDRSERVLRSFPHLFNKHTSQLSTEKVAELRQNVPAAPSLSLNKYKVLPSIEKKPKEDMSESGMEEKTSKLRLSDSLLLQGRPSVRTHTMIRSNPAMRNVAEVQCKVWPKPPGPNTMTTDTQSPSGIPPSSLLLAIREPFGKRFELHFLHTDSLLTVIACAEARYGMRFEHGFIETMDVPRRTFTDLSLTLAQCGIVNRSVLYITQDADET